MEDSLEFGTSTRFERLEQRNGMLLGNIRLFIQEIRCEGRFIKNMSK